MTWQHGLFDIMDVWSYTEDAGCAITMGIPVKFGTAHGRSRPEVGSAKCIGASGRKGVSQFSRGSGNSQQKMIVHTIF